MNDIGTQIHMVMASDTNQHGTIFGGKVMELADQAAAICARRYAKAPVLTASLERIEFLKPIFVGEEAHVTPRVLCAFTTSMVVGVEVKAVNPFTGEERLTAQTLFTFVAIDRQTMAPKAVPPWQGSKQRHPQSSDPKTLPKKLVFKGQAPGRKPSDSLVENHHLVMPQDHNSVGLLFAGRYLAWVDLVGAIAAREHCRHPVVTARIEDMSFRQRVPAAATIRLSAKPVFAARSSIQVLVSGWLWDEGTGGETKIADAVLTFVALDPQSGKVAAIPQLLPESDEEREAYRLGQWRYEQQKKKKPSS